MNAAGVRLPISDEGAAPVTILDGRGAVVRIVSALEFRRLHGLSDPPTVDYRRRQRPKVRGNKDDAIENALAS
jgi:hypothetical protein